MFRVKICGLTTPEDACHAVHAGADMLGLNFVPTSKRYISLDIAEHIVANVDDHALIVGVFADNDTDTIINTVQTLKLHVVQLHGRESAQQTATLLNTLPDIRIIRSCPVAALDDLAQLHSCVRHFPAPERLEALLLDTAVAGASGGTGKSFDWNLVHQAGLDSDRAGLPPILLAGGLTPHNVAQAVSMTRLDGVDVAGGVESAPGRKDTASMQAFIHNARTAAHTG